VQQKMEVLWLKSQGCTHEDIARLAAVSRRSAQRYLDEVALDSPFGLCLLSLPASEIVNLLDQCPGRGQDGWLSRGLRGRSPRKWSGTLTL
jgi:hypothetical protein